MDGQREPGQRLAVEYGQRVVDSLYDILDFVDMAANLGTPTAHRPRTFYGRLSRYRLVGIRGLRTVVAHQYEGVDHRIIWNALVTEFPADAVTIRAMLRE